MIAPEIWSFKPPQCVFSTIEDPNEIQALVRNQTFNYSVTIICPDVLNIPNEVLKPLTDDTDYYFLNQVSVDSFLNTQFIQLFVRKGHLLVKGLNKIDTECLCDIKDSLMTLSLTREVYQKLGLVGKPSQYHGKYLVTIDLKSCNERAKQRLKQLIMDFIVIWEPHDSNVCPSSIAAYFCKKDTVVKTCHVNYKKWIEYNVDISKIKLTSIEEFLEWAGMICFQCPTVAKGENKVFGLQLRGFLSNRRILETFKLLRLWKHSSDFVFVCVNGFSDSIYNRGRQEHHFFTDGDYHYSMIFRRDLHPICVSFVSNPKKLRKRSRK